MDALPATAKTPAVTVSLWRHLLERINAGGLDRRPRALAASRTDLEEVLPRRLRDLLQQALGGKGAQPDSRFQAVRG